MKIKRDIMASDQNTSTDFNFTIQNPLFKKEGEEFIISFYEGILKKSPYLTDCLKYLGNAYTAKGMFAKGLEIDKQLSRLEPGNPEVIYNLACSYSLLKETNKAIQTLTSALNLGYNDIEHLEKDRDMNNIRHDKRYLELVNMLKTRFSSTVTTV